MLPSLKRSQLYQSAQVKLYNPPKQLPVREDSQRKTSFASSSRTNPKIKAVSGFKKNKKYDESQLSKGGQIKFQQNKYKSFQAKQNLLSKLQSTKDLSQQIKLIQKKIRYHKKKLQEDRKRNLQMKKNGEDYIDNDFQKIIKREMELQGYQYQQEENKNFDYLTNPGKNNKQQQQEQQQPSPQLQPVIEIKKPFSITQGIEKLQKHYQNSLKKKFQRREMFPHQACKRKTPKLYITQKTNALQKYGAKPSSEQHLFRILTKQITPQQIYPTIPNFAVVKDSLSKNVMAYLGDYKPFIEKTKQDAKNQNSQSKQKQLQKLNIQLDEQFSKD